MRPRLAALLTLLPTLAAADPLSFELPIRCTPGADCFIQNHFDHDPGPGWRDYACGGLAYDGHAGTDFRLLDRQRMDAGVEVLAAAAGTVVAVRDGEFDVALHERTTPLPPDRAAGNGVRIDHGEGWETQYSHLRRGSLSVRPGDRVEPGTVLGLVGLSGRTDFPHVDFAVRHRGREIDPFVPEPDGSCDAAREPLWSAAVLARLDYRATGVLGGGFSTHPLTRSEIEDGRAFLATIDATAPAIVFQVELFGVRAGDIEELTLAGPDDPWLARSDEILARPLAVRRVWLGKRRDGSPWPTGRYVAEYRLQRGDTVVATVRRELVVAAGGVAESKPVLRDRLPD